MADRESHPHPPAPTHQRYIPGEPARHDVTLEGEILPWVSMAEALGWSSGPSSTGIHPHPRPVSAPGPTVDGKTRSWQVGFPRRDDTGTSEDGYRERDWRGEDEPAHSVTEKTRSAVKRLEMGDRVQEGGGNVPRREDEPSATLGTRTDLAKWTEDRPAPTIVTGRRSDKGMLVGRQLPEGEGRNVGGKNWPTKRPSTTLTGDPRVARPGHHGTPDEGDKYGGPQMRDAVRVTLQEAAILQGFPPDYPFQGSRTKQFQQVGNAVPPPLAAAILRALVGDAGELREAA